MLQMHHQLVDCQAEGGSSYAFDISASEDLTNTAYLVIDNVLHTVDITTGAATAAGAELSTPRVSRGLDPRVTLHPSQAAEDPRMTSGGGAGGWGAGTVKFRTASKSART